MRKRLVAGILLASMMFSIVGCSGTSEEENNKKSDTQQSTEISADNLSADIEVDVDALSLSKCSDEEKEDMESAIADFSINLMKENMNNADDGSNVLVSPTSVMYALAMTGNGAAGENLEQFEELLAGGESMDVLNGYLSEKDCDDGQLSLANSIWIRDDEDRIKVKDDFLALNKYVYDADAYMAPFDGTTCDDINNWVEEKTDGMIPEVLDAINDSEVMYLINAAAFEAKWEVEYEETEIDEDGIFTNYDGEDETVVYLCSMENKYIETDDAKGFIKNYEDGKYAFVGILPNEGIDLNEYVDSLTGEDWLDMYENTEETDVYVELPEFSYEYKTELNDTLKNMGLTYAFEGGADFSNMTDNDEINISRVIHKTFIQVDREGTTAAAATVVATEDCCEIFSPAEELYLDRPFLYAVVDVETGLPIFMGTVNSVE